MFTIPSITYSVDLAMFLDTKEKLVLLVACGQVSGHFSPGIILTVWRRNLPCLRKNISKNIYMWYLDTYFSMSQYFMRPSLPELTIRPASFFPFTIMNFSLIDSILKDKSGDVNTDLCIRTLHNKLPLQMRKAETLKTFKNSLWNRIFKDQQSLNHFSI